MRKLIGFVKQEDGATAIEYGLLASLIAVVIVVALQALGPQLVATFNKVTAALNP
jgi:pilus assembly protein Flp/PilA